MTPTSNSLQLTARALALGLGLLALQPAVAQAGGGAQAGQPRITGPADVTFQLLAQAPAQGAYQNQQVRRFLDDAGVLASVQERLVVVGNGSATPPFQLEFVGAVGVAPDSEAAAKWRNTYRKHASLFHEHGSFRVLDAAAAARNYTIHDFGTGSRAGRTTRRVVVYPRVDDKPIWLLELDAVSGRPLYAGEFDRSIRLLGELEVQSVQEITEVAALPPEWNWRPRMTLVPHATAADGIQSMQSGDQDDSLLVHPRLDQQVAEYAIHRTHVTEDPLNGARSLVLTYSDGIDSFFVVQAPGSPNPLQVFPNLLQPQGTRTHTIAYHDDPAQRVYWFGHGDTTFTIAGSGALQRLDAVAKQVYRQAVARN